MSEKWKRQSVAGQQQLRKRCVCSYPKVFIVFYV